MGHGKLPYQWCHRDPRSLLPLYWQRQWQPVQLQLVAVLAVGLWVFSLCITYLVKGSKPLKGFGSFERALASHNLFRSMHLK